MKKCRINEGIIWQKIGISAQCAEPLHNLDANKIVFCQSEPIRFVKTQSVETKKDHHRCGLENHWHDYEIIKVSKRK